MAPGMVIFDSDADNMRVYGTIVLLVLAVIVFIGVKYVRNNPLMVSPVNFLFVLTVCCFR